MTDHGTGGRHLLISTGDAKAGLRRSMRRLRRAVPAAARTRAGLVVARRAMQLVRSRRARRVALYLACASEFPTAPLLHALLRSGRTVWLPVPDRRHHRLRFVPATQPPRRLRFARRAPAPNGRARHIRRLSIVFVPLLAFDRQGMRLGQGGGYYDRFFATCRGSRPFRVGLAFSVQEYGQIPHDRRDIPLQAVFTERALSRFVGH